MSRKRIGLAVVAAAVTAMIVIGLIQAGGGEGEQRSAAPAARQLAALKGAPAPLASLHAQANELLGGGPAAFRARLTALRGFPVVVNKWASWCGPCRAEFPEFQRLGVKYGKRIAFLGVNSSDNRGDAEGFLRRYPVSYPSYEDPSGTVAQVFNGASVFPTTVFYSAKGKLAFVHQGQYLTAAKLEQDILRYALGRDAG